MLPQQPGQAHRVYVSDALSVCTLCPENVFFSECQVLYHFETKDKADEAYIQIK